MVVGAGMLVALAACRVEEEVVQVKIELPPRVAANRFLVEKTVGQRRTNNHLPSDGGPGAHHIVGVIVPRGVASFMLRVQAVRETSAVAEGEQEIQVRSPMPIVLTECMPPVPVVGDAFMSCRRGAGDGGVDGGGERRDGPSDGRPGGRADRTPTICRDAGGDPPPPVERPTTVSPACVEYCDAMQLHCSRIFLGYDRCLFACSALGFDEGGTFNSHTLGCRTEWALYGDGPERLRKCDHASPASMYEGCGRRCDVYCHIGSRICPDDFPALEDCKDRCNLAWNHLTPVERTSFTCRLGYLEKAIFDRRLCPIAAPNATCGDCQPIWLD
jgi:hypothetical protein